MNRIIVFLSISFISFNLSFAQQHKLPLIPKLETNNFNEISKEYNQYYEEMKELNPNIENPLKGQGFKPFKRWEYFWSSRVDTNGNLPSRKELRESYNNFKSTYLYSKENKIQAANNWKPLGPYNWTGTGVGRINAIAVNPSNTNIIYVGAATGGIWKSTNGGSNWAESVTPDVYSLGISDIAICKTKPNVILAATGDANGVGAAAGYGAFSSGLLLSIDDGNSWNEVNIDAIKSNLQQSDGIVIYSVLINHSNSSKFIIATNAGVYHSDNSGSTWTRSQTSSCRDLKMHPTNPDILYGAFNTANYEYTVMRYVNGSWFTNGAYVVSNCNRVELAVNDAHPGVCYGLSTDPNGGFRNVFKSENSGQSWNEVTSSSGRPNYLYYTFDGLDNGQIPQGGQGWYDLAIAISPKSKSTVTIGGINNWKTTDGGNNYNIKTYQQAFQDVDEVHSDQHTLVYDSKGTLYVGNDGGIYKSTDDGENWTNISAGLNITQYYKFGQATDNKERILAGAQDNGTMLKYTESLWAAVLGGDGFDCDIDPNNSNLMYGSNYNQRTGVFYKSTNGGQNWGQQPILYPFNPTINENSAWVSPLTIDENNSNLYVGYQNVYKSLNQGTSWTKISNFGLPAYITITEIALAPSNSNYIYVAVSNQVFRSTNGGQAWTSVFTSINQVPVRNMTVNPTKPDEIYVVVGGYQSGNKVFKVVGTSSTNITGDLPNFPVNCITYQKGSNDRVYIGTDIGVFSKDAATPWKYMEEGMPQVIVSELKIHYPSGMLRAATYGRGMWEIPVNDCALDIPNITSNVEILNNQIRVCKGENLELALENGNYDTYEWSTGQKTRKINPKTNGVYFVSVFDKTGCEVKSVELNVQFIDVKEIVITDSDLKEITSTSFCEGDSVEIKYSGIYSGTEWSNGEKGKRILWVTKAGTYSVSGFTSDGCATKSQSVTITMMPSPPKPDISADNDGYLITKTQADKYKWYQDGNLLFGEEESKYKPIEEGDYFVETIINGMECTGKSDSYSFVFTSVPILENNGLFRISPNPFDDLLTISNIESIFVKNIKVIDLDGRTVKTFNSLNKTGNIDLNLNVLSVGTYILQIETKNSIVTQKIIKN
ncbi:MAG: hypothetical protein CVV25_04730 [Ignavibacteriae bacterium HGW-Ignavibacteriae-4]|jgi:photosystem II stability/assembly factor-like uncharacterized protein|nr:MAG: hypothetical protein CVV25_04730 [Ignavibacteriae bacterium HGW-Ignavibacteriae-4]